MGQSSSTHVHSGDTWQSDTVRVSQIADYDTTYDRKFLDKSITSTERDSQPNADSVSAMSVDVHNADNNGHSPSFVHTRAVKSSDTKTKCQPWFFANMTQEHWERLNMMCIEIPSGS